MYKATTTTKHNNKIGKFSLIALVAYIFFGFVFTKTIIANNLLVILSYAILLLLFVFYTLSNIDLLRRNSFSLVSLIWTPFLLYTIVGYGLSRGFERLSFWTIALLIVLLSNIVNFNDLFPKKMIVGFGVFLVLGVFVQFLFPDFYNRYVASLFLNGNSIIVWGQASSYAGFTYQLGNTAELIIISEITLLFSSKLLERKRILRYLLIALFIAAIFLTGKRTLSILSIAVPLVTHFFSIKKNEKRFAFGVFVVLLITCAYYIFANYAYMLSTSSFFGRLAKSFLNVQAGSDITSDRTELSAAAIELWKTSPLIGIGVSKFINYSHFPTDVHNVYLQTLCEQGAVGFALFVIPLAFVFIKTIILMKNHSVFNNIDLLKISLSLQTIFIIDGLTENKNINTHGYLIYFIAIALVISTEKQINETYRIANQRDFSPYRGQNLVVR